MLIMVNIVTNGKYDPGRGIRCIPETPARKRNASSAARMRSHSPHLASDV